MTRPSTKADYLASLVPPSVAATRLSRRSMLRGAAGAAAAVGVPALLAACSGSGTTTTSSSAPADSTTAPASSSSASPASSAAAGVSGTLTVGSNQSDKVPKATMAAVVDGFGKANSGVTDKINTVDHNTFQENINNYLQGSPDDVFTWFAGFRMRYFAAKGLAGDVSDVWPIDGLSDAFKNASTGTDGKQYFVPQSYYPWAIFYRPSVFKAKGYTVPKTLDELKTLGDKMKKDGLIPIAFGDKDGWPAMGTFDQLNLRQNGYDFHISLMAGKEAWDGDKVKNVFKLWASLLPYHQPDSLGRTWQEAAQALQQKKAGMYLLGLFVSQQFAPNEQSDLDFFKFPEVDSTIGSDAIEAPIDGWMMAAAPKNGDAAKAFLKYVGSADAANVAAKVDNTTIWANSKTDTSGYTALQKKSVEFVASAKNIAQFLDRDTDPTFASTVMIPAIQTFIKTPTDIDGLVKSIASQAKSILAN